MTTDTRPCRRCGEPKPLVDFPRNKHAPGGIDKMCKQCWKNRPRKNSSQLTTQPKARVFKHKKTAISEPDPTPVADLPKNIEYVDLPKLARLPGNRKFFEQKGSLAEGLKIFKARYKVNATIVYTFKSNHHFIG